MVARFSYFNALFSLATAALNVLLSFSNSHDSSALRASRSAVIYITLAEVKHGSAMVYLLFERFSLFGNIWHRDTLIQLGLEASGLRA